MNLSAPSSDRLMNSFEYWKVSLEYSMNIYNYLVHGYSPGSFYTAVLANDFTTAMVCSHPGNTEPSLKNLAAWMVNAMPKSAWGSYNQVTAWCDTPEERRREILERHHLIYTPKEEMWLILKGGVDNKLYHGEL
jgi:hypothetical protein